MQALCKIPVGLLDALQDAGVSHKDVLTTARLPAFLLETPAQWVSTGEYFALWQSIRMVSGDPSIGIALVKAVKPDITEPLFLATMSAADVAGAIDVVAKYKRILAPSNLVVRSDDASGGVVLTFVWPDGDPPQALIDAEYAFMVEMCRRGTRSEQLAPIEVRFRVSALDEGSAHARFFRCPIRLGAPDDALVFAAEDLNRPFLTFNPQMLQALVPFLETHPSRSASPTSRVRSAIAERLRGQRPTVQTIGRELAMSARSLQRLLKEHGTSFRRLLDEVRNDHARRYLSATSFSDGEVSFLLGFEDSNSFYRAFRSWNGMSPNEFRRHPRE